MDLLSAAIVHLVEDLPDGDLRLILDALERSSTASVEELRSELFARVASLRYQQRLAELFAATNATFPAHNAGSLALAIRAARAARKRADGERVTIVCTGPTSIHVPTRRTDQVLLELVDEAKRELWLVSFAALNVPVIWGAVGAAVARGVHVHLVLETVEESDGRLSFDQARQLADQIRPGRVYIWPSERRRADERGRLGLLHAKCAIADDDRLFITSANVTEMALWNNLEIGALIERGSAAEQLATHFRSLVYNGVLVEF